MIKTLELANKTVIVTGAGRGIGRQTAIDLSRLGCKVVIASRNPQDLEDVAREIVRNNGEVLTVCTDLSRETGVHRLMEEAVAAYDSPDILINNAGVLHITPFMDVDLEQWDQSMNINLRSAFLLSQLALKHMIEKRDGYIINISSTAALNVAEYHAAYGSAKAALAALSQSIRNFARPYGIKVSTVYPGVTDTAMVRGFAEQVPGSPEQWMTPEDISACITFLLQTSDRCLIEDMVPLAMKV